MFHIYSKQLLFTRRLAAGLLTAMIVLSSLPPVAFAQVGTTTPETTVEDLCIDQTATNFNETGPCAYGTPDETGTSTPEIEDGAGGNDGNDGTTASSTPDSTASSTPDGTDGSDTPDGTDEGTATSTDDGTSTSTPPTNNDGEEGSDGPDGEDGTGVEDTTPDIPIPVVTETEIGEDTTPDDGEGITGEDSEVRTNNITAEINTGNATAQSEVTNDTNSNLVRSEINDATSADFDRYEFNASGTNDATITTGGVARAKTGDNYARSNGIATITTGDAVAAVNVANVINSNVVNSDGFLYLKNQITEPGQSLNLSSFFFPDPEETKRLAKDCALLTCRAEEVEYTFSQQNVATIDNVVDVDAVTGMNEARGAITSIETGDARAGANVINVVNTNIVDSNYRLLAYNALGDLDGDLILPTQELFHDFFARPNGISQSIALKEVDNATSTILNINEAIVNNDIDTYAESGQNTARRGDATTTDFIITGKAESESNIFNKVNTNTFGGDSLMLQIRVHGDWSGDVKGLPAGLDWNWAYDAGGIVIYIFNEGAEIAASPELPYDIDMYHAKVIDHNKVTLDNRIRARAHTGHNTTTGPSYRITTGDAIASANVMNIANTNIIGTNWTYATINIYGDFDGDIAFSATDIGVTGSVTSADNPVKPGSKLNYKYVVKNNSDKVATNVRLRQTLQNAYATGTNNQQTKNIGTLNPGDSQIVNLTTNARTDLASGTFSVTAVAEVFSDEADSNSADNSNVLVTTVIDSTVGGGTTTPPVDDGTGTSTDDGTGTEVNNPPTGGTGPSGGSKPGGGGSKHEKKDVERVKKEEIDPASAPFLIIKKTADIDEDDVVSAGEAVNYTITLTNKGGQAYDAVVYDVLKNDIGSILSEQSWELGTILAGEVIELTYTTEYDFKTPSGIYTNTASVEGYRHEDSKEKGEKPLTIDTAEHKVTVKGVPLAVGNVSVLAVFPGTNGDVSALVSWETSKTALSQMFYGPKMPWSTFNEKLPNLGYPSQSFKFSKPKERHLMIIKGLKPGTQYAYRFDAKTAEHDAVSREYDFTIPKSVNGLALNVSNNFLTMAEIMAKITGKPAPAPYTAAQAPAFVPPKPAPAPEPTPEPTPAPAPEKTSVFNKVKSFFGFGN